MATRCSRLCAKDKDIATIPFIFLTARGEKLDVRLGMNYGADDYLTKPVGHESCSQPLPLVSSASAPSMRTRRIN